MSGSNAICPVNTESECVAQSGEWCKYQSTTYSGGATGWCASKDGCPVNDKATCVAKGRTWCPHTYEGGETLDDVVDALVRQSRHNLRGSVSNPDTDPQSFPRTRRDYLRGRLARPVRQEMPRHLLLP